MPPNTLRGRIVDDTVLDVAVACDSAAVCTRRNAGLGGCLKGATTRSVS
jgi:hypothetical protein